MKNSKRYQKTLRRSTAIAFVTVILLATAGSSVQATECNDENPKLSKEYDFCMDKSGGVTVDMRACIHAELARQDARLNRVYQKYSASAEPHILKSLKEAQRAWIQFRNKDCEWAGAPDADGTLGPLVIDSCHLDMTARRADEFENLLSHK